MNFIKDTFEYIRQLLTWWVEIMPWEQGIRVTLGKHQKKLTAGIWMRLPIIHTVYAQPIRFRIIETPLQTVSSKHSDVMTVRMAIGYQIIDIIELFNSSHDPQNVIANTALGISSDLISSKEDIGQKEIQAAVLAGLQDVKCGISVTKVYVTNFARVRTFRIIGDSYFIGTDGENINIKKP